MSRTIIIILILVAVVCSIIGTICLTGAVFLFAYYSIPFGIGTVGGILALFAGLFFVYYAFSMVSQLGYGEPLATDDLDKRIIYMFLGSIKVGPDKNIAVLTDAEGAVTCVETKVDLPAGTDYVKRTEISPEKFELTPITKTEK